MFLKKWIKKTKNEVEYEKKDANVGSKCTMNLKKTKKGLAKLVTMSYNDKCKVAEATENLVG